MFLYKNIWHHIRNTPLGHYDEILQYVFKEKLNSQICLKKNPVFVLKISIAYIFE